MSTACQLDIIIPVYRGVAQTKACVAAALSSLPDYARVIIVNDASPEQSLADYFEQWAREDRVQVLHNAVNVGFVASVNRAMALSQSHDVILLNSDTLVAPGWVEAIMRSAARNTRAATITPFSNNATICSYPLFCHDNPLLPGIDVAQMQQYCQEANQDLTVSIPTGVGFCMYIRRACLKQIGLFDEQAFGRGYGEENDFCIKASYAGWDHLLAADCFVYHQGSVSFAGDKAQLTHVAETVINDRYPEFFAQVREFVAADAVKPLRERIDKVIFAAGGASAKALQAIRAAELPSSTESVMSEETTPNNAIVLSPKEAQVLDDFARDDTEKLLFISHAWGGGVEQHVALLRQIVPARVMLLRGCGDGGVELCLMTADKTEEIILKLGGFDAQRQGQWLELLSQLHFDRIHLHHVHGWSADIISLIQALALPLDITLHDYYLISPRYHQTAAGAVCEGPGWPDDDAQWQALMAPLVRSAARIIAPSESVMHAVEKVFPEGRYTTQEHPQKVVAAPPIKKVLLLGSLSPEKGLQVVEQVATLAAAQAPAMSFHLVGFSTDPVEAPLSMTGDYQDDDLPRLIAEQKPDVIWLPAQVPETFCFTLSHAMAYGAAIVASDIGALAERLAGVKKATLVPFDASASQWLDVLKRASDGASAEPRLVSDNLDQYAHWYMSEVSKQNGEQAVDTLALLDSVRAFPEAPLPVDRPIKSLLHFASRTHHRGVLREVERRLSSLPDDEAEVAPMREFRHLHSASQQLQADVAELTHCLREANEEFLAYERSTQVELNAAEQSVALSESNLEQAKDNIAQLQEQARDAQLHIDNCETSMTQLSAQVDELIAERDALLASFSWRITRPLRVLKRALVKAPRVAAKLSRHLVRPASYARLFSMVRRGQWQELFGRVSYEANTVAAQAQAATQVPRIKVNPELLSDQPIELAPLTLHSSAKPLLSIVIPVYGQHETTYACLKSIADNPPSAPFEVVIADDCSPEPATEALAMVDGLRIWSAEVNQGFVGNMNAGAEFASGEYLVLLNNDTVVSPGAFDALLATFSQQENVGLVGAKLLNRDGTLQEAGGIIWRDGSGWNYGRDQDADDPRFNYVRDVDYCSGAALAIKRELFLSLDGFDTYYSPAYYEDTDLAFRVRAKGLRVLYQPAAAIYHLEGISHGRDESSGVKAYQVTNGKKFFERWQSVLHHHADNGIDPDNQAHRNTRGNVLVVEACMITPDQDSGSIRMLNLLKLVKAEGYHVTFVADNLEYRKKPVDEMQAAGIEVLHNQWAGSVRKVLRKRGPDLTAILISRHYIASQYITLARACAAQARLIFDTVDLHFVREEREFEVSGDTALKTQAAITKRKELDLINKCDVTLVVSEFEKTLLAEIAPEATVDIVSNIHSHSPERPGYEQREGILFVGGFRHPPNIDAVQWYAKEVLPFVAELLPGVTTSVIGSHMPDDIKALGSEHLIMHGFVEDIEPHLQGARISIAPLRYGAGVKGKVNEAMNYGIPVVATNCAVEGMHTVPGDDVMVAEDPREFAEAIAKVYQDAKLWQRLSQGGIDNLDAHFSPQAAAPAVRRILN
ncbi:glycosyltransferase [Gilvimarinus agarilyticus]|uniref:glycosyltransferase n=1 Tax=Gilvimarinus agarilyticus TaxID=679259 RepID=UPI00069774CF|nr:glycosyltransferase [Gilvimarinus agarilyticus]